LHRQVYEMATTANSLALTRYAPCLAHHQKSGRFRRPLFCLNTSVRPAYKMYRLKSWSFTTEATICFTYSASIRNTFSGPDAVMRSS